MNLGQIATKSRQLSGSSSDEYTDANLLIDINIWYQKIITMILESQDEANFDDSRFEDYPILTGTLVSGQRDYPISSTERMLKFDRLDITYDGVNWYKAEPIDEGEMNFGQGPSSATTQNSIIDGYFDKRYPKYDLKYNSIWIYPMANSTDVSNGASFMAQWSRDIVPFTSSELTTGTVEPGFDSPFHPMLSYGAAFELANARINTNQIKVFSEVLRDYEIRLRQHYSSKQKDRQFVLIPNTPNYSASSNNDFKYGKFR